MKTKYLLFFLLASLLFSCNSRYEKLLKSNDNELKFSEAQKYYEHKNYMRAYNLLESVSTYFKGTDKSEDVLFLLAKSYYGNEEYLMAIEYFKQYTKTFPNGKYAEDCWFMMAESHYQQSPDARLDQAETTEAINSYYEYLQIYPSGTHASDAKVHLDELQDKLAYKAYLNAKLYYNLGNYQGNNYLSAIITAQNALKDYPDCKYKEELSFLILESKYEQANKSVLAKKSQRYSETVDEYYNYIHEYPQGEHLKTAEKILKVANKYAKE